MEKVWNHRLKPSRKPEGAYCRTDASISTLASLPLQAFVDALPAVPLSDFFTWIISTPSFGLSSKTFSESFIYLLGMHSAADKRKPPLSVSLRSKSLCHPVSPKLGIQEVVQ